MSPSSEPNPPLVIVCIHPKHKFKRIKMKGPRKSKIVKRCGKIRNKEKERSKRKTNKTRGKKKPLKMVWPNKWKAEVIMVKMLKGRF
jgi:hypothetical protein